MYMCELYSRYVATENIVSVCLVIEVHFYLLTFLFIQHDTLSALCACTFIATVTKSPSLLEVIWRGIPCIQSWRTAVWCFARMIGDIRMNIEKELAQNCIFISFLRTRNEGKSGSTVIDGKFAKLLYHTHTEPTLPSAMTVQILEETILLTPHTCVTAKDADAA